MPILHSNFTPSLPFKNGHFNTIYRPLFVKETVNYERKRISTWDHDFIDLDFSFVKSNTLVLLIHGLEGSSSSSYMLTTTKYLNNNGFDTVCMNLRGCSGEDNLVLGTYHSGKTDDVNFVVNYLSKNYSYQNIVLVGFSLGGNLTLKYLGEYSDIPEVVQGAISVSVPVDLTTSQAELSKFKNRIYLSEFLKTMKTKIIAKAERFPDFKLDRNLLMKASKFKHIEKQYTVPVFGFKSSEEYWIKASSKPYIPQIKHPTLLINSLDDSFLSKECYPFEEAEKVDNFYLITPDYGGHVGFLSSFSKTQNNWLEQKMVQFIKEKINLV
ncbi:hypothetical protein SAMN04489761_1066 [Tenacibaculum sp. MAR_2009_124]|uniref:YheT family hydrolase n=1 Tax=Tenacibaculum sp. MAR_2009_124 TaxID=1250059 RepID=UPI0008988233|nr:alpha/beta fold hydrolase [Tenacibaculum sp. MAR_2009_124]SEB49996.1 hypothetical protein SAMN04489761_1066 [Tenacibaculum sp. MAR_2009_124]